MEKPRGNLSIALPLLIALALTSLVSPALARLSFAPGLPLPATESGDRFFADSEAPQAATRLGSFSAAFALLLLGILLVLTLVLALRGVSWKRILPMLWSAFWRLLLLAALISAAAALLLARGQGPPLAPPPPPKAALPAAREAIGPAPLPLIIAAALLLAGAAAFAATFGLRSRGARASPSWAAEARRARREIGEGADVREAVIRCYARMSEALSAERGIERGSSMTTEEFEEILLDKGLDREPVRELTFLFDRARYGRGALAPEHGKKALACLDAILGEADQAPGEASP